MITWLRDFVTRVGGMIVAPRSTLEALRDGQLRGGLTDLVVLALLQLVAMRLPTVVSHVLFMNDVGFADGLLMLLNFVARGLFIPVLATLAGAVVVGLGTSYSIFGSREEGDPESDAASDAPLPALDFAALCALPAVALQTVVALWVRLGAPTPPRYSMMAVAALWFVVLLVLARLTDRRAQRDGGSTP
ncbi:MAG: hypothetical protein KC503_33540 [Myxococcales bacterium]|nr:hypothetical protein [Myxococcales bacterium]